ncbi:MAG: hypothetical protein ACLFRF_09150 [Desulfobacterales bacterium]
MRFRQRPVSEHPAAAAPFAPAALAGAFTLTAAAKALSALAWATPSRTASHAPSALIRAAPALAPTAAHSHTRSGLAGCVGY